MNYQQYFKVNNRTNLTWFYPKICKFQDAYDSSKNSLTFLQSETSKAPFLLYIHIPFCESFCAYCACYKESIHKFDDNQINDFVKALLQEMAAYAKSHYFVHAEIQYIIFGGGTPSILGTGFLEQIFGFIMTNFNISNLKGISFEGNVMSLKDVDKLRKLKGWDVTRISFGLQTFNENLRKILKIKASI